MSITYEGVWADVQAIRKNSPLIHNITNYVVMEQTANSLLAIGASPIMAHAIEEVQDIVKIASSLVLNIGTLSPSWIQAMSVALQSARHKKIPIVLDPVGAGATPYRTKETLSLLDQKAVTAIRGNASEIVTLYLARLKPEEPSVGKGVDSLLQARDYQAQAQELAKRENCVVWMSGATDIITDGTTSIGVHNGHPFMSKVTGMGCTATAITGAFLVVNPNPLLACAHAACVIGVAGEIAAESSQGPGSFKLSFIDALYNVSEKKIEELIRYERLS